MLEELYLSGNQQSTNNGLSMSVGCDVGWQVIQLPQLYIHRQSISALLR